MLKGIDLQVVGVILMVVGAVGLMFSLLFWSSGVERRRGRNGRAQHRHRGGLLRERRHDLHEERVQLALGDVLQVRSAREAPASTNASSASVARVRSAARTRARAR